MHGESQFWHDLVLTEKYQTYIDQKPNIPLWASRSDFLCSSDLLIDYRIEVEYWLQLNDQLRSLDQQPTPDHLLHAHIERRNALHDAIKDQASTIQHFKQWHMTAFYQSTQGSK